MSPVLPASSFHTVSEVVTRLLLPYAVVNTTIVAHEVFVKHTLTIVLQKDIGMLWRYAQHCLGQSSLWLQPLLGAQLSVLSSQLSALSSQHDSLGGKAARGPRRLASRLAVECLQL